MATSLGSVMSNSGTSLMSSRSLTTTRGLETRSGQVAGHGVRGGAVEEREEREEEKKEKKEKKEKRREEKRESEKRESHQREAQTRTGMGEWAATPGSPQGQGAARSQAGGEQVGTSALWRGGGRVSGRVCTSPGTPERDYAHSTAIVARRGHPRLGTIGDSPRFTTGAQ